MPVFFYFYEHNTKDTSLHESFIPDSKQYVLSFFTDFLIISQQSLGGGVWRTKWNILSDTSSCLFLSCMQGGSSVIEYSHSDGKLKIKATHLDSHPKHLAYGIDIIHAKTKILTDSTPSIIGFSSHSEEGDRSTSNRTFNAVTLASCSFYDNLVQIWDACL
jgi:hypothetical protein